MCVYMHAEGSRYDSLHKRMSMEPSARVKLDKLEWVSDCVWCVVCDV